MAPPAPRRRRRRDHDSDDDEDEAAANRMEEDSTAAGHGLLGNNNDDGNDNNNNDDDEDDAILRILVSTDNHLGYCERDAVRGMDSFAAFEEVLCLAKHNKCDMVLLGGDLFHDNKPSRRTLHKTMELLRRYCLGPHPVRLQFLSDPAQSLRQEHVNYAHPYVSVDLPIFSIHGNHDDPTRDAGGELLAALDLLSVNQLVNYMGRQEQVQQIEIYPLLLRKGNTNIALYGLGSLRDERLNRMWSQHHVHFYRPSQEDDATEWFSIFVLHQNRDLGRGSKNCIHEAMIPEWMDLVVWGHEHECLMELQESVVGTFRITQPGSSVATSLIAGEAVPKNVGLLEIQGSQFRLSPIPLLKVRSFVLSEVCLNDYTSRGRYDDDDDLHLDPEDAHVDRKVTTILEGKVQQCIMEAREKRQELVEQARRCELYPNELLLENDDEESDDDDQRRFKTRFALLQPEEVLVRVRVEHSGFTTLNHQRFGARFVGKVANPLDLLLFHRRRGGTADGKPAARNSANSPALASAVAPPPVQEMQVDAIVKQYFERDDHKRLELITAERFGQALDEYVTKQQVHAMNEAFAEMLEKTQDQLIRQNVGGEEEEEDDDDDDEEEMEEDEQEEEEERPRNKRNAGNTARAAPKKRGRAPSDSEDMEDDDDEQEPKPRGNKKGTTKQRNNHSQQNTQRTTDNGAIDLVESEEENNNHKSGNRRKNLRDDDDEDDPLRDDDDVMEVAPPQKRGRPPKNVTTTQRATNNGNRRAGQRKPRGAAASSSQTSLSQLTLETSMSRTPASARAKRNRRNNHDEDDDLMDDDDGGKKRSKKAAATPASYSQRSFSTAASAGKRANAATTTQRKRRAQRRPRNYNEEDDDDSDFANGDFARGGDGSEDDWGTKRNSARR